MAMKKLYFTFFFNGAIVILSADFKPTLTLSELQLIPPWMRLVPKWDPPAQYY